jgi:L-asparaginase
MPDRELPSVSVLALGGTIAATGAHGVIPTLSAEQLVSDIPEIGGVGRITANTFRQLASAELTLLDIIALAHEIETCVARGDKGVVVTQGTNTIEETAFALDLLVDTDAPVIVTGAMRNPQMSGADGPANLLAAVRTAVSDLARGIGTLVVFADQIHAARFVRKVDTQLTSAFRSSPAGPIGWLSEGAVRIGARPVGRYHLTLREVTEVPPVALLTFGSGDEGSLIQAVGPAGYQGLIVEGVGGGHVPASAVPDLEQLAQTMPVILASRTGEGEALRRTYAFEGSEIDLLARGLISAGPMTAARARVLLRLLLAANSAPDQVREAFNAFAEPGVSRLLINGHLTIG